MGGSLTGYLDEVHLVEGWETLVRQLMGEGGFEVFVSGSPEGGGHLRTCWL